MTELGQHAGELITEVQSGVPMFVRKHGRVVAMIVPVDSDDVERVLTETIASARIHDADPTETLATRKGRRSALPFHKLFTAADAAAALGVELPDD
jgi:antitoxin (DNA-binding transcriptional repressor) of toxin-antitoxin stability system